ncbi:hypothetical protein KKH30_00065, partial [Candidatus Micrarchaeota archaeon]|nr:hypothetical protein [Candidatus Micrarchaeota archaeon]MBU1939140.1 hypothetical protein [Candidatus Micrarchaeota archaeon]
MILPFDEVALQFVQQFANPALDVFFLLITELGNPIVWLFAAAFIYWLDRENDAFFLVNLVTFSAAIGGIVKVIVARPRPDVEIFRVIGTDGLGFSFPSAHAMVAASEYGYFGRAIKGHGGKILA